MKRLHFIPYCILFALMSASSGCGSKPPAIHQVSGKVTLKGKGYPRLFIYFRQPGNISTTNHAVAETDADGNFTGVLSTEGQGLQAGEYRVTFSCEIIPGQQNSLGKREDLSTRGVIDLVPPPYDDRKSREDTPVRFMVQANDENRFVFDIPAIKESP